MIGLWKYVFMNNPIKFFGGDNKTKFVPGINISLNGEIYITAIISMHYEETNETIFFYIAFAKKTIEDSNKENLKVIKNTLPNKSGNPKSFKK